MPRKAKVIICSEEETQKVGELSRSRSAEARMVERAKMVVGLMSGRQVKDVAKGLSLRENTVILWRDRFIESGVKGLMDLPRSGKPSTYGSAFRLRVLETLERPPPKGQSCWDGPALAQHLKSSKAIVWRVLRKEGISLSRQRSWCVSTDPEFSRKSAEIVGLYLNPPEAALVISVDEKPSIQALERATGYVETSSGKIVRGLKSTYKRHGTLNLFAALEVATGQVHGQTTGQKRRVEFLAFMDKVVEELPKDKEIHVIMDNYCIHKKNDAWLAAHSNVRFHYTPTSASWLNMVEIWFGIMSRKVLRAASFKSIPELRQAIEDYMEVYRETAKPFVWRKREVKGSQLRNTIVNLCN